MGSACTLVAGRCAVNHQVIITKAIEMAQAIGEHLD